MSQRLHSPPPFMQSPNYAVPVGGSSTPIQSTQYAQQSSYRTMGYAQGNPIDQAPSASAQGSVYQPAGHKAMRLSKNLFLSIGMLLLTLIFFLPVWDCISLLSSKNFVHWEGTSVPVGTMVACGLLMVLFVFMTEAYFDMWRHEHAYQSTTTLAMAASVLVTLLGLMLVVVSIPLTAKTIEVYNDLMFQCQNSQMTRGTWATYQDLLQLRQMPDCLNRYSIEECNNFQATEDSSYLKAMEEEFRCSGFCVEAGPGPAMLAQSKVNLSLGSLVPLPMLASASMATKVSHKSNHLRESQQQGGANSVGSAQSSVSVLAIDSAVNGTFFMNYGDLYPPTLFSNANFKVSCDGAAARNMLIFSREIGYQWWWLGIGLISISICIGMYEWSKTVIRV